MRRAFFSGSQGAGKAEPVKKRRTREPGKGNGGARNWEPGAGTHKRAAEPEANSYAVADTGLQIFFAVPGSMFLVPPFFPPRLPNQVFGPLAEAFEELSLVDYFDAELAGLVGLGAWALADHYEIGLA